MNKSCYKVLKTRSYDKITFGILKQELRNLFFNAEFDRDVNLKDLNALTDIKRWAAEIIAKTN